MHARGSEAAEALPRVRETDSEPPAAQRNLADSDDKPLEARRPFGRVVVRAYRCSHNDCWKPPEAYRCWLGFGSTSRGSLWELAEGLGESGRSLPLLVEGSAESARKLP